MAVTNKYRLQCVQINATVLGGILKTNVQLGSVVRNEPRSGELYTRYQVLAAQNPRMTFTTENIGGAIDLVPLIGYSLNGTTGLKIYNQKDVSGGGRDNANCTLDHMKLGLLVLRRLSAVHQGDATLDLEAFPDWNTNDAEGPILRTFNVAGPTAVAEALRYALGKVTLGLPTTPLVLDSVRSIDLDFGLEIESEGSQSDIWPTFVSIKKINPKLMIKGIDLLAYKAATVGFIPQIGAIASIGTTSFYLRRRVPGGTFVADATAQHIKFTGHGYVTVDAINTNGPDAAEIDLTVEFASETDTVPGTQDPPLTVSTVSAIT